MIMRAQFVIPVLASILILGTLGIQEAFADTQISTCQDLSSANTSFVLTADVASSGTCFSIFDVNNVSLDCNDHIITGDGSGTGIDLFNSHNSEIKNCNFTNFSTGITHQSGSNNLIEGNTVNQNDNGIFLSDSQNNLVTHNTANQNTFTGIIVDLANNNDLIENTANHNEGQGIFFTDFSIGNYMFGNTANGNTLGPSCSQAF